MPNLHCVTRNLLRTYTPSTCSDTSLVYSDIQNQFVCDYHKNPLYLVSCIDNTNLSVKACRKLHQVPC